MCNIDITVVLLNEHVFTNLVTNIKMGQLSVCTDPVSIIRRHTDR